MEDKKVIECMEIVNAYCLTLCMTLPRGPYWTLHRFQILVLRQAFDIFLFPNSSCSEIWTEKQGEYQAASWPLTWAAAVKLSAVLYAQSQLQNRSLSAS